MAATKVEKVDVSLIVASLRESQAAMVRKANRTELLLAKEAYMKSAADYGACADRFSGKNLFVE